MKVVKRLSVYTVAAGLLVAAGGCANSFIKPRDGVERVSIAQANQVAACQLKVTVLDSVLAKVGFIVRDANEVEADLLKMAFNDAAEAGGDTVVKGESPEFGKRVFSIYQCRP